MQENFNFRTSKVHKFELLGRAPILIVLRRTDFFETFACIWRTVCYWTGVNILAFLPVFLSSILGFLFITLEF